MDFLFYSFIIPLLSSFQCLLIRMKFRVLTEAYQALHHLLVPSLRGLAPSLVSVPIPLPLCSQCSNIDFSVLPFHTKHTSTSEPLYLLFSLSGVFFPRVCVCFCFPLSCRPLWNVTSLEKLLWPLNLKWDLPPWYSLFASSVLFFFIRFSCMWHYNKHFAFGYIVPPLLECKLLEGKLDVFLCTCSILSAWNGAWIIVGS